MIWLLLYFGLSVFVRMDGNQADLGLIVFVRKTATIGGIRLLSYRKTRFYSHDRCMKAKYHIFFGDAGFQQ